MVKLSHVVRCALLVSLAACNGGSRPNYSAKTSPPELAWATTPPAVTVSSSLTVSITAADPTMGVGNVYVLVGSSRSTATQQSDGSWAATITLPVVGHNIVTVWADDQASPVPNSGLGLAAPYQLTADVNYSPTPPSLSYDSTLLSYSDERTINVATDANGSAVVPPSYTVGPRTPVVLGGDVYKVGTRLSGGAMTAAELESTNAANIPVLRFAIVHDVNTDPAIEAVTYAAHVTCTACASLADASGSLLLSPYADAGHAYYDFPLTTETIPALAQIRSTALISVTLTVTDAAGNVTTAPGWNVNLHLVGPPVAIVEDSQYASKAYADSTYGYQVSDGSYGKMWDATWWRNNQGSSQSDVRLLRYIITNPAPTQVAIQVSYTQASQGSWQANEQWVWSPGSELQSSWTMDGFTFSSTVNTSTGTPGCVAVTTVPSCPTSGFAHQSGSSTRFICLSAVPTAVTSGNKEVGTYSTGDVMLQEYRVNPALGQERAPNNDSSGQWYLIPEAADGVPGALVVYLTRPVAASRARPADAAFWGYEAWTYKSLSKCGRDGTVPYSVFGASRYNATLAAAQDNLFGAFSATTSSYNSAGVVVGDPMPRLNVSLNRIPLATH